MSGLSFSEQLAEYAFAIVEAPLPGAVAERARSCLLYALSIGLAADRRADVMYEACRDISQCPGDARELYTGRRLHAADAAFLNATTFTARGQNDTHPGRALHLGSIVLPALLALAESRAMDMDALLRALTAGYEVAAKAALPALQVIDRGFRSSSVFGVLGAATAAGIALKLSRAQMVHALALAANQSGGLLQCWEEGTMEWRLHIGNAARAGVQAALLAQKGMEGARTTFEGANGFYRAFGVAVPDIDFGVWDILSIQFKLAPGCAINQGPLSSLLSIMRVHSVDPSQIERIEVVLTPQEAAYPGLLNLPPFGSEGGALMSLPFMLGIAARYGAVKLRDFSDRIDDGEVLSFARRIVTTADPALKRKTSRTRVLLKSGRVIEDTFDDPARAALDWPATVDLCRSLATEWPPELTFDPLAAAIDPASDANLPDAGSALMSLCCVASPHQADLIKNSTHER